MHEEGLRKSETQIWTVSWVTAIGLKQGLGSGHCGARATIYSQSGGEGYYENAQGCF